MPTIEKYKPTPRPGPPTKPVDSASMDRRQEFLTSARWRKVRQHHLRRQPMCEAHAAAGQYMDVTSGGHVDHIIPWQTQGGAPVDYANLLTLCISCHSVKTNWERSGSLIVAHIGAWGDRVPAEGERERVITELAKQLQP